MWKVTVMFVLMAMGLYGGFLWDDHAHPMRNVTVQTPQGTLTGDVVREWTGDSVLTDEHGVRHRLSNAPLAPGYTIQRSGVAGLIQHVQFTRNHWRAFAPSLLLIALYGYLLFKDVRVLAGQWM